MSNGAVPVATYKFITSYATDSLYCDISLLAFDGRRRVVSGFLFFLFSFFFMKQKAGEKITVISLC